MTWLAAAVVGYLCGAIPFAYLLTRAATGEDLRTVGSGNVGATNVQRHAGWPLGLTVLALDVAKGVLAAWAGHWLGAREAAASMAAGTPAPVGALVPAAIAGVAAVAGHVYPAWLRFAGGKGVATAAGAFGLLAPVDTLGAAIAFVVVVWRTKYVSLGSVTAAILLPVLTLATGEAGVVVAAAAAAGGLVVWRHRENIERLRRGVERRLGDRHAGPEAPGRDQTGDTP